jgi:hypothetical protein
VWKWKLVTLIILAILAALTVYVLTQVPGACSVHTVTTMAGQALTTTTYDYYPDGKIQTSSSTTGLTKTYTYPDPSTVIMTQTGPPFTITYTLNALGQATSDTRSDMSTTTYDYDTNGFQTKATYPDHTTISTPSGGNIVTQTHMWPSNPSKDNTFTFTYTTIHFCRDDGIGFLGKQNAYYPFEMTQSDGSPKITYHYTLDADGRVETREQFTGDPPGSVPDSVSTFTYY